MYSFNWLFNLLRMPVTSVVRLVIVTCIIKSLNVNLLYDYNIIIDRFVDDNVRFELTCAAAYLYKSLEYLLMLM